MLWRVFFTDKLTYALCFRPRAPNPIAPHPVRWRYLQEVGPLASWGGRLLHALSLTS